MRKARLSDNYLQRLHTIDSNNGSLSMGFSGVVFADLWFWAESFVGNPCQVEVGWMRPLEDKHEILSHWCRVIASWCLILENASACYSKGTWGRRDEAERWRTLIRAAIVMADTIYRHLQILHIYCCIYV